MESLESILKKEIVLDYNGIISRSLLGFDRVLLLMYHKVPLIRKVIDKYFPYIAKHLLNKSIVSILRAYDLEYYLLTGLPEKLANDAVNILRSEGVNIKTAYSATGLTKEEIYKNKARILNYLYNESEVVYIGDDADKVEKEIKDLYNIEIIERHGFILKLSHSSSAVRAPAL